MMTSIARFLGDNSTMMRGDKLRFQDVGDAELFCFSVKQLINGGEWHNKAGIYPYIVVDGAQYILCQKLGGTYYAGDVPNAKSGIGGGYEYFNITPDMVVYRVFCSMGVEQEPTQNNDEKMTYQERLVLEFITAAWDAFVLLDARKDEVEDFCQTIHHLQDMVAARVGRRCDKDVWVA